MLGLRWLLLVVILLIYLVAGTLYAVLTPQWQAPDEPAHYNYIRYLANEATFPELVAGCYNQAYLNELTSRRFPPKLSIDSVCYEFHQPPLYYLLATPVFIFSNGSLLALRLFSVTFGGGVVVLAFVVGQTIFPNRLSIAFGTMAFVAFVPMHVAILASVNNDALAELILAVLLLLMIRRICSMERPPLRHDLLLGLVLGLGLVTKTTVYIAVPLVVLTLWFSLSAQRERDETERTRFDWSIFFKQVAGIYGLAFIIALPWYIRNVRLYGSIDILGLARHNEIVIGQLRTLDFLTEVGVVTYASNFITTTFRSFWGQFGWMAVPMDSRTYSLLTILTFMALGGLVVFLITVRSSSELSPSELSVQRNALTLMAMSVLLMCLAYGWYNITFVQFQGRYLFPGLIPLGLFFSLGLGEALNRERGWWLAGGLTLALTWVVIATGLNGQLDKWATLIIGLTLSLIIGHVQIARYWPQLTPWLLAACYAGLSLLTLAGPFWFVVPYL